MYILTQYHCDTVSIIGIFSSKERAIDYLELYYPKVVHIEEFDTYMVGIKNGWEIVFEITEYIVDDISMNKELIFPN